MPVGSPYFQGIFSDEILFSDSAKLGEANYETAHKNCSHLVILLKYLFFLPHVICAEISVHFPEKYANSAYLLLKKNGGSFISSLFNSGMKKDGQYLLAFYMTGSEQMNWRKKHHINQANYRSAIYFHQWIISISSSNTPDNLYIRFLYEVSVFCTFLGIIWSS